MNRARPSHYDAAYDLTDSLIVASVLSGSVTNTRLAVRKCRGGPQGQEFHFTVRKVQDPTPDEDGDPITHAGNRMDDWADCATIA